MGVRPPVALRLGEEADALRGTAGDDYFGQASVFPTQRTTDRNDVVEALAGNDLIDVGAGHDTVYGGTGNDSALGGAGDDFFEMGGGRDGVYAGDGDDTIFGGGGNDVATEAGAPAESGGLRGGAGDDSIDGGKGNDLLAGEEGNDRLVGGQGRDSLHGDAGDDYLSDDDAWSATPTGDLLDGGAGDDIIEMHVGDSAYGGEGNDRVSVSQWSSSAGWPSPTFVDGGEGNDSLSTRGKLVNGSVVLGGAGDDTLDSGEAYGCDETLFDGGEGNDFITMAGSPSASTTSTLLGGLGDDTISAFGTLLVDAGSGNDQIEVPWSASYMQYRAPHDMRIVTGEGRDRLVAPKLGQAGDSVVVVDFTTGAGGDSIDPMPLVQALPAYDDTHPFGGGWLRLVSDRADTLLQYNAGTSAEPVWTTSLRLANVALAAVTDDNFPPGMGPSGGNTPLDLLGTSGDDTLAGSSLDDTLRGAAGNDSLDGSFGGDDLLYGGAGDDRLYGRSGNDQLRGGTDQDQLWGDAGDDLLEGGAGDDDLDGADGLDTLRGGDGNDWLVGDVPYRVTPYADRLEGGAGNDTLSGGAMDTLLGGEGADTVGGSGSDLWIDGGEGNDLVSMGGSEGGCVMLGGAGNDDFSLGGYSIYGGPRSTTVSGALIDGGAGDDDIGILGGSALASTVEGGAGSDDISAAGQLQIDAGTGDDTVRIDAAYTYYSLGRHDMSIALGEGRDTVLPMPSRAGSLDNVVVTDFSTGTGGDVMDLSPMLAAISVINYRNKYDNAPPFSGGWVRLLADGADTLVQLDIDNSVAEPRWITVLRLQNVAPDALTDDNFAPGQGPSGGLLPLDLLGSSADDRLIGAFGDDRLRGGDGNDTLEGGFNGNDSLYGEAGADALVGFAGNDLLDGGAGNDAMAGGVGNDTLMGGDGDDKDGFTIGSFGSSTSALGLEGGEGNDVIYGGSGNDLLAGGSGADTLWGGEGDDTLDGSDEYPLTYGVGDVMHADAGNDELLVYDNNIAYGGDGDDLLTLFGGGIVVDAGAGNDRVESSSYDQAQATVTTGEGADVLVPGISAYEPGNAGINLEVTDFDVTPGADRIDLKLINSALGLADSDDPFLSDRVRLIEVDGVTHLEVDLDNNHDTYARVLSLEGVAAESLTYDNFVQDVQPVVGTAVLNDGGAGQALRAADLLDDGASALFDFGAAARSASTIAMSPSGIENSLNVVAVAHVLSFWQPEAQALHAAF